MFLFYIRALGRPNNKVTGYDELETTEFGPFNSSFFKFYLKHFLMWIFRQGLVFSDWWKDEARNANK